MACPLFAIGQGTVPVMAMCGMPNPAWVPVGVASDSTLTATTTAPSLGSGQTLQPPTGNWEWTVLKVEYSDDGVTYTQGGVSDVFIPSPYSATATVDATFFQGAYWRVTCQATVGFSETPGAAT